MSNLISLLIVHPKRALVNPLLSYLAESTSYFGVSPLLSSENLPLNDTINGLVKGLAEAHKAYGDSKSVSPVTFCSQHDLTSLNSAHILFVVQPHERNVFDQRLLEYKLCEL